MIYDSTFCSCAQKKFPLFRFLIEKFPRLTRFFTSPILKAQRTKGVSFMGTVVVGAGLLVVVGLIIRSMVKDKKSGKHSCGGDCGNCGGCH